MDGANLSGTDYRLLSEALEESTELLREEITRLRKTAGVLRSVNSQLRNKIEALMKEKDELFLKLLDSVQGQAIDYAFILNQWLDRTAWDSADDIIRPLTDEEKQSLAGVSELPLD